MRRLSLSSWCGSLVKVAANEVQHGPVSRHVVENIRRLREGKGWSYPRLSEEMTRAGRPILSTGLHRLENGKRRIDVDDLTGLALALDVSPITLLMPFTARGTAELTPEVTADALDAWDWMRGLRPLPWSIEQMAERLAPLPAGVTDEGPDVAVEDYVAARFRLTAVPMGARIGELRGAELEERLRKNADVRAALAEQLRENKRRRSDGGEHPEAP